MKNKTIRSSKKFYIGRRTNPQFNKPYFVANDQLSKTEAKLKEKSLYGSMTLTSYDTVDEYNKALADLENEGFTVYKKVN